MPSTSHAPLSVSLVSHNVLCSAVQLSYIAAHDAQCAARIVSMGAIPSIVDMMSAEDGRGDDDLRFDMKEVAIKCIYNLCVSNPGNQGPIAERGAVPPLINILVEPDHQPSIKEAAAGAISKLAANGVAQDAIVESRGVDALVGAFRAPAATDAVKRYVKVALRLLAVHPGAKKAMLELGILQKREQDPFKRTDSDDPFPGLS